MTNLVIVVCTFFLALILIQIGCILEDIRDELRKPEGKKL